MVIGRVASWCVGILKQIKNSQERQSKGESNLAY